MNKEMRIAFVTYGAAPIPATKGGAVENIIENFLKKNEIEQKFDVCVVGLYEKQAAIISKKYKNTVFRLVKCPRVIDYFDKIVFWFAKFFLKKRNLISYRYMLRRIFVTSHYPKILLSEEYDYVILVANVMLFYLLKNRKISQKYKDKVVFYLHNEIRSLFGCSKEAMSIKALIGVSDFVNNSYKKHAQIDPQSCYILKNCIDTDAFISVDHERIKYYKNLYNIDEDDLVVIFSGRIVREKGAIEVVRAVKECKNEQIKLLIVGGEFYSTDLNDKYMDELINEAKSIENQVIFTGYINYRDMPALYQMSKIAILPSLCDEAAGMTMIEAAVCGIPLITTKSGGVLEYIPSNAAIFLERDEKLSENICMAIKRIISDEKYAKEIGENGKALAELYDVDNYYRNFSRIIESMGSL